MIKTGQYKRHNHYTEKRDLLTKFGTCRNVSLCRIR